MPAYPEPIWPGLPIPTPTPPLQHALLNNQAFPMSRQMEYTSPITGQISRTVHWTTALTNWLTEQRLHMQMPLQMFWLTAHNKAQQQQNIAVTGLRLQEARIQAGPGSAPHPFGQIE